ncbi:MAG: 2-dehydropantoate 2-reductase [Sandaracinaceae bacterium]|nr:2-dehydropantoate 2-reductase [Sandaracinaceae bacterium]
MQIGIFGAGAIGCFLGTRLSAAGESVRLLARPDVVAVADQLEAVDHAGATARAKGLVASDDPEVLRGVEVCLVTVKSQDTPAAIEALRPRLGPDALVVSFQNGLANAKRLDAGLEGPAVQGIVTYNVYRDGPARTRQATMGKLVIGAEARAPKAFGRVVDALRRAGERVDVTEHIEGEVAGKLLINLNNGVCAATGLPITAALRDRDARTVFAACIAEGVRAFRAEGVRPRSPYAIPIPAIARLLALPNAIVLRVAKGLVAAHPTAKSSTLQDLERGRKTEIADLNGAIVELARAHGLPCPANTAVVDTIREHEAAIDRGEAPRFVDPVTLRARVRG